MDFGAFVNFFGPRDGLVHISELAPKRVGKTTDVVQEGQAVKVKLLGFDDRGKVRLSMKVVDQATGEDITEKLKAEAAAAGVPFEEDQGGPAGGHREHRGGGGGRGRRDHHRGHRDDKPEEPKGE